MQASSSSGQGLASPRWWPFWIAFGAGLALRLLWLDLRPLHHDEGVNGWFIVRLLEGYRYEYDPERFHGPFLYFFGAPWALLLGMSETVLRLPVALASASMPLLLLPLRSRLGRWGITLAAWLLAVSPSLVYYGRDLIHETYLVLFTLALVAAASRWLESGRERYLILAALSLSLMFTVKETAALTLAVFAAAGLAAWFAAGRLPLLPLPLAGEGRGGGSWRTITLVLLALAIPYLLLYTSFFTHPAGLVDSFRAYLPWTEKGFEGSGHEKPWHYFLRLLLTFETAALVAAVLGSVGAFRRRSPFGIFCAVWWLGQLAAYSAIPYKTPWLAMNVVLPMILCAGMLAREPFPWKVWKALVAAGLLAMTWTASRAVDVSFLRHDDERLGLVYVQAPRELRDLIALIEEAAARSGEGKAIAIRFYTGNRWPLPWYLRGYTDVLWGKEVPADPSGDVLICDPAGEKELRSRLQGKYRRREITLRPRVKLVVFARVGEVSSEPRAPSGR